MNVIAYDLGTGGMKASLYGPEGECLASHFAPYDTHYPQSGWHEQRLDDWWAATVAAARRPPVTRPWSRTVTARTAEVSRRERGHGRGRGTGRCRRHAAPAILNAPFSETNDRTRPPRPPRRHRASGR